MAPQLILLDFFTCAAHMKKSKSMKKSKRIKCGAIGSSRGLYVQGVAGALCMCQGPLKLSQPTLGETTGRAHTFVPTTWLIHWMGGDRFTLNETPIMHITEMPLLCLELYNDSALKFTGNAVPRTHPSAMLAVKYFSRQFLRRYSKRIQMILQQNLCTQYT